VRRRRDSSTPDPPARESTDMPRARQSGAGNRVSATAAASLPRRSKLTVALYSHLDAEDLREARSQVEAMRAGHTIAGNWLYWRWSLSLYLSSSSIACLTCARNVGSSESLRAYLVHDRPRRRMNPTCRSLTAMSISRARTSVLVGRNRRVSSMTSRSPSKFVEGSVRIASVRVMVAPGKRTRSFG
jgi:hypothetical protein